MWCVTWCSCVLLCCSVHTDSGGHLEEASNAELGRPGTFYPGAFSARGLEGNDSASVSGDKLSLSVYLEVSQPGDWMRVVTGKSSE